MRLLSSLLYVGMNVVGAMKFAGYSSVSQTVSELSAIGAPTRTLWVVLAFLYTLLVLAFGYGVWRSAGQNRRLRTVGGLLIAYGALGALWPFAPMHLRGAQFTLTDAIHIGLGAVTVLLMLLAIGTGAAAMGKHFRVWSIVTLLILVVFGVLTGFDAPSIAGNLPTPWVGLWERINIGSFLLWVVVLAISLLRSTRDRLPCVRISS